MRTRIVLAILILTLGVAAGPVSAQGGLATINQDHVYCSGQVSKESISHDTYIVSGEEASPQTVFSRGDYVYLNKGSDAGVKPGDEYSITRPVKDIGPTKWYSRQGFHRLGMGTQWMDIGRVRVVKVHGNTSTAIVSFSCDFIERGDYAHPFAPRTVPQLKTDAVDRFAAPSGRPQGLLVSAKGYVSQAGTGDIVYMNVGSSQGAKEGDYVRIFRYQGENRETAYQIRRIQDRIFGFGKTPAFHGSRELPREILGEGIVLRASDGAATVLITGSLKEIYVGDYVELK